MEKLHVSGYNADVDTGAEDVWVGGGTATIPTAAAATNVISGSTDDDGSPAGTGARTVRVHGLDASLNKITEDATMDGTTQVVLSKQFLKVNAVEVLTAGSGLVNAGVISVRHTNTVLISIAIGQNRSQAAFFTPHKQNKQWRVTKLYYSITNAAATYVAFRVWTRKSGALWQNRHMLLVGCGAGDGETQNIKLESPIDVAAGEDVRIQATATGDNTLVAAAFDIEGDNHF